MNQSYIEWRKFAPYHDPDINEFYLIIDYIKNNKNFTIIRLSDGEYSCLIDNQSLQEILDKNITNKYVKVLNEIIHLGFLNEDLLLGFETKTPNFFKYEKYLTPIIKKLNKIYSSSIFSHASVTQKFSKIFDVLFEKNVLLVGPQYLSSIQGKYNLKPIKHIITPTNKVWEQQQEIENEIENWIIKTPNLIIIYACSITTKISALKFYKKYKNQITQIDVGAALDPYARKISRPWHEYLIQEIYE